MHMAHVALVLMILFGRDGPEYDAGRMFTDIELRFLAATVLLGGCRNRKHDSPPRIMWRVRTHVRRRHRLADWGGSDFGQNKQRVRG